MSSQTSLLRYTNLANNAVTRTIVEYMGFDPLSPANKIYSLKADEIVEHGYRDDIPNSLLLKLSASNLSFQLCGSDLCRTLTEVFNPMVKATILAESPNLIPRALANILFLNDSSNHKWNARRKEGEEHFSRSRKFMLDSLQHVKTKKTAVLFGPGPLEIEGIIPKICELFEEVILVGKDPWYLSLSRTCNKIQVAQIDLSQSFEEVLKIIESGIKSGIKSGENISEKLVKYFDNFKFQELNLPKVDFATSSLVSSELGDKLILFLGNLEKYLGEELRITFSSDVFESLKRFSERLIEQHLKDLHDLGGVVYYSDTVSREDFNVKVYTIEQIISDKQLNKIKTLFKSLASDEWYWIIKNSTNIGQRIFLGTRLLVKASIMRPKLPEDEVQQTTIRPTTTQSVASTEPKLPKDEVQQTTIRPTTTQSVASPKLPIAKIQKPCTSNDLSEIFALIIGIFQ